MLDERASQTHSLKPWLIDPNIPPPEFWPNGLEVDWVSHWADFKITTQGIIWLYCESFRHDVQYFLGYKIPMWQWENWEVFKQLKPLFKPSLGNRLSKYHLLGRHTAEWCGLPSERTEFSREKIDRMFKEDLRVAGINRFSAWLYYQAVRKFGRGAFFD